MNSSHYIFSYGTLRDSSIQKALFNRTLLASPDCLRGYRLSKSKMYGQYLVVENTGESKDRVWGSALAVTEEELLKADTYEGDAYGRVSVKLESGRTAWVYVAIGNIKI